MSKVINDVRTIMSMENTTQLNVNDILKKLQKRNLA